MTDIDLRASTNADLKDIIAITTEAFRQAKIAELTAALLRDKTARPVLSLLAFANGTAAGHILFTKVYVPHNLAAPLMHILAPLAVKPQFQRLGFGGQLINAGLKQLTNMGSKIVFVLGDPAYYQRYGFMPNAAQYGFAAPYPIPEKYRDCWMLQPLAARALNGVNGQLACANALNNPEYWRED